MLTDASYGKSGIRLVKVLRRGDRHDLIDLTVAVRFEGDYDASYTDGDNRRVLPTDTMKNTVYALAARGSLAEPEAFGLALARHFLARNPHLHRVTIEVTQHLWDHVAIDGRDHGSAFVGRGPEQRTAVAAAGRDAEPSIDAGIDNLLILKSSGSAFAGFLTDELTSLPETHDRILATSMTATWRYARDVPFGQSWHAVRRTLLDTFARHRSASVQHTLFAMGQAVIDHVEEVTSIHLVMPNKHHLPVDLSRFGLENRNELFVATDEPFGRIEATVARK